MYRLALTFFSAFLLFTSPAFAKDARSAAWIVSQLSGEARVVHGGLQPASLKVNSALSPGDVVITGPTGRATLSREADYIVLAPRSELRLPSSPQPNGFTRVLQNVGTMLFRVQHTGVPHFAVDTPMLAAVVKGTTFTIVVDRNRSAVQVTQGVVEVTANDGGMQQLVEGGKTVFINHSDPKTIIDADSQPAKASATTSAAVKVSGSRPVSLASITSLTGGLVRAEATPRPASGQASTVAVAATPVTAPAPNAIASSPITHPVVDVVETTVGTVTQPIVDVVETAVPGVTDPVIDLVQTTVPVVTEPVVDLVQTAVPAVTEPVVDIVQTAVPAVTEPVVDIVQTTVPAVTEPVIDIVQTTAPAVTKPVIDIVQTTVSLLGGL